MLHFWISKNCKESLRASAYFLSMAPGGPGTGPLPSSFFFIFDLTMYTTARTTAASTMRAMNQPHHPLDFDFSSPICFCRWS